MKKSIPSIILGLLIGAAGAVLILKLMCPGGGGEPVPAAKPDEPPAAPVAVEAPIKAAEGEVKK